MVSAMLFNPALTLSDGLLASLGMQMYLYNENRIPEDAAVIAVSNHRSFMDALILISALKHPVRIAAHHYMGQIPLMGEFLTLLGCFPLATKEKRQQDFIERSTGFLKTGQWVGLFPEGGTPMVQLTSPKEIGNFNRGFAHLALRANIPNLVVLPIAIAATSESINGSFPTQLLRWFDPQEALFAMPGQHPVVVYHRANIVVGHPYWITQSDRQNYQGKGAKKVVQKLCNYCHDEISQMLTHEFR